MSLRIIQADRPEPLGPLLVMSLALIYAYLIINLISSSGLDAVGLPEGLYPSGMIR